MNLFSPSIVGACLVGSIFCQTASAQRQMESLGRGVIAVKSSGTQVYVGWRLLGNDPQDVAFNLYRSANGAPAVKVNGSPLTATTDYVDTPGSLTTTKYTYSVKPVLNGVEVADTWANPTSTPFSLPAVAPDTLVANAPTRQYIPVPIQPTPDDASAGVSYSVKFCWVGDFDGDGEYDFLIDRTNPSVEARQWLQAYKRDGTLLWQMNMGPNSVNHYNITPGSSSIGIGHGDNVTVYDLDGDGKAEVVVRTANGVVFANGTTLTAPDNEVQYISIIDGSTGVEKARATVPIPSGWVTKTHVNGQMGIVYADGVKPSIFFHPSNRNPDTSFNKCAITWDYRNGQLTQRWIWLNGGHTAEGHQVRFADVDNDGKDEYVDIGNVVKADGSGQINENVLTEVVHGDRFHVTDIDPDRPGLETFLIQQNNGTGLATVYSAADKSSVIKKWYAGGVVDVGRGTVGDFVPTVKGCEFFSTQPGVFDCKTNQLYASGPFPPETIWWDGDLGREFVSTIGSSATSPGIDKFNTSDGSTGRVISLYSDPAAPNSPYNNYIAYGGRPQFWGDILGDWREELLCVATDNSELRIYTTKTPDTAKTGGGVPVRIYTLMHNPQYRVQATTKGYVQSSYVDYYLGNDMTPPPPPPMVDAKLVWRGGAGSTTWDAATQSWLNNGTNSSFTDGDGVRFDISGNNATTVTLNGTLQPSALTVYSPKPYLFDGSSGSLAGAMTLMKAGAGTMNLSGNHGYTGKTTIWDGALILTGNLQQSPVTVWGGTWGGALVAGQTGGRIGGTGTFGQPVKLAYRGAVTPGNGMGSAGTLNFASGLTAQDGSCFALDLSNDPTGTVTPSDRIAITGNLSVSGKVGIVIKALNGTLPAGTYTLATYTGTLTGNVSNFTVTVPPGTPYTLSAGSGVVSLTVPVTRAAGSIVWRGSGAAWDLASSQNWLLGGNPNLFVSGDNVAFDATGSAAASATLTGTLPVGGVTVNAATNYTFTGTGSISGSGGLTKSGTGTLTISTVNDYTGPTTINGGVLAIDSLGDAGTPGSIGAAPAAAGNFVINGGTLRLTGLQTNTNRSLTLGSSGGTFDIATNGSSMQISGAIDGSGSLVKTGPGTLILATGNTYTGGTVINEGTLYLAGSTANVSGLGTGTVTLNSSTLTMANVQASETAAWNLVVPAGMTSRLNADGRCSLTGSLTGSGVFNYYTPYVRTDLKGNWSAFTGQINVLPATDGGEMRVSGTSGFAGASINIGDGGFVYFNVTKTDTTLNIGELTGVATSGLGGGPTSGNTVTWRVGGKNTNATFDGTITNSTGTTAITKQGTGIWTLTGACTYTGATTVSAGTLRINGSTTGSAVTVQSAAALGGSGTITGNVSVQAGGVLEHGTVGATPLAITGNLTFGGNAVIRPLAGISVSPDTYTVLTYTGTLSGTPAFSWQAPAGSTLVAEFSTATVGTITMTLSQPSTTSDLTWTGNNSFNWDTATANWTNGSGAVFANGSNVSFTETGIATSPVNITLDVEPVSVTVNAAKNYTLTGVGRIAGAAVLNKSGTGTLTLSSANTYTGGTTISGGTLSITSVDALGTGSVTLAGGTWAMGTLFPTNPIIVTANSTITGGSGSGAQGIKAVTGSHTLTLTATNVFDIEGSLTGFSGTVLLNGSGSFRFFGSTGSAAAAFDLGTRSLGPRSGSAFSLGSLTGVAGSSLGGSNGYDSAVTHTIGGNNLSTTFSGVINNGNTGSNAGNITHLVKTGSGTLTLAGANTYTGTTTVTAGKLTVTGSLANTATTVATTGTLGGTGSIAGAVTCNGALAPGTSAGTLTLSAGLTLASTSTLAYELGTTSDRTAVTGNLTLDGTVNVSAATGFAAGTYTLITYTGTLTNNILNVGTLPAGYNATVNTATAGQVRLVVTSSNAAPQISAAAAASPSSLTTSNLTVSATDDAGEPGLTYTWSSTGPASVGFSTNATNSAKNVVATYSAPGSYTLTVAVQDVPGLTAVSSVVVNVTATPVTLTVSPPGATLAVNATQGFTATAQDQFGTLVSNPSVTWSASGVGGSIDQQGVYSATAPGGPWQVSAELGGLLSSSPVTVIKASATVTLGNLTVTYDGTPKPVSPVTNPPGMTVILTYDGSATPPTIPGTYAVAAVIDNANYAGGTSGSLVIASRSFGNWETSLFTPEQIAAGESAPGADPDNDNLTNLAEYALGAQPYAFTPQPAVSSDATSLSITFQRPAWIGDVIYQAEASPDFNSWSALTLEVLTPGADPETVRAIYTLPEPKPAGNFLRLRFEK